MDNKFGPYVHKIGKMHHPIERPIIHTENLWQKKHWAARQNADGKCFFEFQVSRQGGGTDIYEITKDEFERVKNGKLSFDDLIKLTDFNPCRSPCENTD